MDKAVELDSKQMKEFKNGWPKTLNDKLSRVVMTQVESGKYIKVGDTKVFNTEFIYTRVIGIQASSRETDIKQLLLLSYELSEYPQQCFQNLVKCRLLRQNQF